MTTSPKRTTMRGLKDQFRMERRREVLDAALQIVNESGLVALTMGGVADVLGCGTGTIYQHFGSKGALIADLQREAIEVITSSLRLSQANVDEALAAAEPSADEALVALTRLLAAVRFWIAAETRFPQEIDLSRRIFIDPTLRLDDDDAARILPSGLQLLDMSRQVVEDAQEAGAVRPGVSLRRAVVVIAATTGVLMTSGLDRWDAELFNGPSLARELTHDLLTGWGADEARLAVADGVVAALVEGDRLVPEVRER